LKLNVGRNAGISPRDLVGAIAGESGIPGRMIGTIKISDDSSTIEIPKDALKKVKVAMQGVRIKGKRVSAFA
jgi:ATP-dependent RNA helicase DeaD